MHFLDLYNQTSWEQVQHEIYAKNQADVEKVLASSRKYTLEDFKTLISPAAAPFLETMALRSHQVTKKRFGNTLQLFAPLYLSNKCSNICTYCGFSADNKIPRKVLNTQEILQEARYLKTQGFDHVLIVTGEATSTVGVPYFKNAITLLRELFSTISIEVQPLEQEDYQTLILHGLHATLIYQETYNRPAYKQYHPKGKKSDFEYRLNTPERLGCTGVYKIGIGTLLGLEDWRVDAFYTVLHLTYLEKKYYKTHYAISFPRLRPHAGQTLPPFNVTDHNLTQLICAYRLFNPEVELSLSTRESQHFRDHIIKLGITTLSAGSKTNPGGYTLNQDSLEQFEISDNRSPSQIQSMLTSQGYEVVWKNWAPLTNLSSG